MRNHTATYRMFKARNRANKLVESPHGYPLALVVYAHLIHPQKVEVLSSDSKQSTVKITLSPSQWALAWNELALKLAREFCAKHETREAYKNQHGEVFLDCGDQQIKTYYLEEDLSTLQMIQKGYIHLPFHPVYCHLWIACPEIAKLPK